jgi:hypothetical protein
MRAVAERLVGRTAATAERDDGTGQCVSLAVNVEHDHRAT